MKQFSFLLSIAMLFVIVVNAQISLPQTWKFHTGDDPQWDQPDFNDSQWENIKIGSPWEDEGHPGYDGFAWYRTKVVIPSSMKSKSSLSQSLKIALGKIDDGDQVYLNGKLIGQNAERGGTIEQGDYNAERVYKLPMDDPAIRWGQENTIAVRVLDHGGEGGMWAGPYYINTTGISDYATIDDHTDNFHFGERTHLSKRIMLKCTSDQGHFSGELTIQVVNPDNQQTVWEKAVPASFSASRPFAYTYSFTLPADRSYEAKYIFTDNHLKEKISAKEGIPYLLTPPPSQKPQINGATITGVRPGHPFLFCVPATGKRPMEFFAKDLPEGLHIDKTTGIITGTVSSAGTYRVMLSAKNPLGTANRELTIKVGDMVGLTPAMGWNSWNVWGLSVNEKKVEAAADVMVKNGLANHGWTYINIDDGWERPERAANGEIVPNSKFPDMKALANYIHGKGLKMGIYSSPGPKTCGGFTGSYQHEAQDAHTYAKWGIDYLKYDWCSYGEIAPKNPDLYWYQKPYKLMDSALRTVNRDIYFSLCQYGMGDVWNWGAEVGGNSWRTTGDINDSWQSMSGIGFHQNKCAPYAGPGHWNDPDMLVVGEVGWGPSLHNTHLSPNEQYTHISLWCLLSAPLLIGCDMSHMDDFTRNLLTNDEVLALDQDPLGKEATQVAEIDSVRIYEKDLADGNKAVGLFNVSSRPASIHLDFSTLGLSGSQRLRDLWRQKNIGIFTGSYEAKNIPVHGVLLLKVTEEK